MLKYTVSYIIHVCNYIMCSLLCMVIYSHYWFWFCLHFCKAINNFVLLAAFYVTLYIRINVSLTSFLLLATEHLNKGTLISHQNDLRMTVFPFLPHN